MKKKTLDTLLKKKDSKAAKQLKTSKTIREGATVTYKQTCAGAMLSFPAGCNYPLASQPPRDPPQLVLCSVCRVAAKKYSCSVTGSPLCSLQCYKKNLALRLGQGHVLCYIYIRCIVIYLCGIVQAKQILVICSLIKISQREVWNHVVGRRPTTGSVPRFCRCRRAVWSATGPRTTWWWWSPPRPGQQTSRAGRTTGATPRPSAQSFTRHLRTELE